MLIISSCLSKRRCFLAGLKCEDLSSCLVAMKALKVDGQCLNSICIREPQLEQNMAVTLWSARNLLYGAKFAAFAGRGRLSLFRHLFRCFDIYFGVSTSISVFFKLKNIFVYFEIYLCVVKYICVFWNICVYFEIYLCVLKYICVFWNRFVCFKIYLCVVKYICVFWNIFVWFEIYICVALVGHRTSLRDLINYSKKIDKENDAIFGNSYPFPSTTWNCKNSSTTSVTLLGPVVQSWVSANPGLKFNPLF